MMSQVRPRMHVLHVALAARFAARSCRARYKGCGAGFAAPLGTAGRAARSASSTRFRGAGCAGLRRGLSRRVRGKARPACIPSARCNVPSHPIPNPELRRESTRSPAPVVERLPSQSGKITFPSSLNQVSSAAAQRFRQWHLLRPHRPALPVKITNTTCVQNEPSALPRWSALVRVPKGQAGTK
ncbi:unnamed protein product [Urochloa humidicola]